MECEEILEQVPVPPTHPIEKEVFYVLCLYPSLLPKLLAASRVARSICCCQSEDQHSIEDSIALIFDRVKISMNS